MRELAEGSTRSWSLDAIFTQAAASQGARTLLADGIHPTDAGNELLARNWWEAAKR